MKTTQIDLPIDLEKLRPQFKSQSQSQTLSTIILKAATGEYHCFQSKHKSPKLILVSQLSLLLPQTRNIIEAVKSGAYDEKLPVKTENNSK